MEKQKWCVSPAYDLTYSNSIGGEHATMVNGNGKNPQKTDLLAVADKISLSKEKARIIVEQIETTVKEELSEIDNFK